jgi:hypothetical protein
MKHSAQCSYRLDWSMATATESSRVHRATAAYTLDCARASGAFAIWQSVVQASNHVDLLLYAQVVRILET